MKIALIGPAHPYRGGIAAYIERLALQLQNEGHEVTIYTFTLQYPDFLFPGESQFTDEPPPKNLNIIRCINAINPLNWFLVGNRIKKTKPDLVIIKYWLPFFGLSFGTILRRIKSNRVSKIICNVDNIIPHETRIGDRIFTKYFVKPVNGFVSMSKNVFKDIDQFDQAKPKILSPHPIYDHYGEIVEKEIALKKLNLSEKYRYIMFFGLIRKYKGLDLILQAFADKRFRDSNIKLIIAGEYYSDKKEYQDIIDKNSLSEDIIQIDKFIPDSQVKYFFSVCDLVVQPYKSATQSGITQIAYHFNKPMIVTNVGGLRELCPDEKVGYVVEPNPREIANAILRFFENTNHHKMIDNIKEEKKKYSWEILTQNTMQLLTKINH